MNDLNFFVREVGRGKGVLERSLEIAEMLRGVEEGDGDRKSVYSVCTYFGNQKDRESLSKTHMWTNQQTRRMAMSMNV